jgi:hypothetical protein
MSAYTGPPYEGERYADADEWEFHMNGPHEIPGARWHNSVPSWRRKGEGVSMDLVVPVDTAPLVW